VPRNVLEKDDENLRPKSKKSHFDWPREFAGKRRRTRSLLRSILTLIFDRPFFQLPGKSGAPLTIISVFSSRSTGATSRAPVPNFRLYPDRAPPHGPRFKARTPESPSTNIEVEFTELTPDRTDHPCCALPRGERCQRRGLYADQSLRIATDQARHWSRRGSRDNWRHQPLSKSIRFSEGAPTKLAIENHS